MSFIGVDGCPDGWFAVRYGESGYLDAKLYDSIDGIWDEVDGVERILIDVPIGLREDSKEPRPCDSAARRKLSPLRHHSVFPPPIRAAVHADSYEAAKEIQETHTDGSLGVQSWGISDKIAELDSFLREAEPTAVEIIQESHPEVCFWALNDEEAMTYSKSGQPAAAFWERVRVLESVDSEVLDHVRNASEDLDAKVKSDDVIDALVLALTASPLTNEALSLPRENEPEYGLDPTGELPMQIVYANRK